MRTRRTASASGSYRASSDRYDTAVRASGSYRVANGTYGSAVRSYGSAEPAPVPRRTPGRQTPGRTTTRRTQTVRKNRKAIQTRANAYHFSARYTVFLTTITILAAAICIFYLSLQSKVTQTSRQITELQTELSSLKEANDAKYNNAKDSVNIDEVKQTAISEYGMVYAGADQVITYSNPQSDYMKQYQEIPEDGISKE